MKMTIAEQSKLSEATNKLRAVLLDLDLPEFSSEDAHEDAFRRMKRAYDIYKEFLTDELGFTGSIASELMITAFKDNEESEQFKIRKEYFQRRERYMMYFNNRDPKEIFNHSIAEHLHKEYTGKPRDNFMAMIRGPELQAEYDKVDGLGN